MSWFILYLIIGLIFGIGTRICFGYQSFRVDRFDNGLCVLVGIFWPLIIVFLIWEKIFK